jgi:hypothetical protein
MKARILATATVLTAFSTTLPAVDPQLLSLAMPDAKLLAGVNVAQAKTTPFGQYVLSQLSANDPGLQQLATVSGFDPRRDLTEVLLASAGASGTHTGIAAATGMFDVQTIQTLATNNGGVKEMVGNVAILEDPNQTHGVAFLSGTLVVAGDLADVKAAIARQNGPTPTGPVFNQANALSGSEDAWAVSTVPLSTLGMNASKGTPLPMGNGLQNSLGNVQSVAGGVKFGSMVEFTAQLQADTAQNATTLAGVIQFLANMAQLNAGQNQQAASALQSLMTSTSGATVNVALSLPEDQFQQLLDSHANAAARPHKGAKKQ